MHRSRASGASNLSRYGRFCEFHFVWLIMSRLVGSCQLCRVLLRVKHPVWTASSVACRVMPGVPCHSAVSTVSTGKVMIKWYHLGGSGQVWTAVEPPRPCQSCQPSRPCQLCHDDHVSCVSFGRVVDEHRFFVSCMDMCVGSRPCRVLQRTSCLLVCLSRGLLKGFFYRQASRWCQLFFSNDKSTLTFWTHLNCSFRRVMKSCICIFLPKNEVGAASRRQLHFSGGKGGVNSSLLAETES